MTTRVSQSQSEGSFFYRIELPDKEVFILQITPLNAEIGTDIFRNYNEEYVVVSFHQPHAKPIALLRGFRASIAFLTTRTGLSVDEAAFIKHISQLLTTIPPAFELVDHIDNFVLKGRS